MRCVHKTIDVESSTAKISVYILADLHLGNSLCDERLIRQVVKEISDNPLAYVILLGDLGEFIGRHDKRHQEESYAPWVWGKHGIINEQRDYINAMLAPLRGKVLSMVEGNHERSIKERYEFDIHSDLVYNLKANPDTEDKIDLGTHGYTVLHIRRPNGSSVPIRFYSHHGWFGSRLSSGHALNLERLLANRDFDIGVVGHGHRLLVNGPMLKTKPHPRSNQIVSYPVWTMECGSFLKSFDPKGTGEVYGEKHGYAPMPTGYGLVEIVWDDISVRSVT